MATPAPSRGGVRFVNGVSIEDILSPLEDQPELVQRISKRKAKAPELTIVEPDPIWIEHAQTFISRISAAFDTLQEPGSDDIGQVKTISINHVGSTSVPGLPAKAVIDLDLVLSPNTRASESFYVPRLEAAGFQFLLREPEWYEHRFFVASEPMLCNLHVWGPRCAEAERHRIFRDWLREHEDDRELYARTKRECAAAARESGEGMMEYTDRKNEVVGTILTRAYIALGMLPS